MELSEEIQNILQKYKVQSTQAEKCDRVTNKDHDQMYNPDDVIDVDEIIMPNDQTWLIETDTTVQDLNTWLYGDFKVPVNHLTMVREKPKLNSPRKNIDSRTFTRPKKKMTRPSIEKYNEEYFDGDKKSAAALSDEIDNYISNSGYATEKALHFDLSQPTSGNFFDKILSTAPELDSFQNMSPPSLVNSMCSSTFTNLMENSYIKNDPVLREIRDADYSQMIYQDSEPPLFQSFTESCSSINSEVAENFVRKTLTSLNGTFTMNASSDDSFLTPPAEDLETFANNQSGDSFTSPHDNHTENIDPNIPLNTHTPLNGTFRKGTSAKLKLSYENSERLNGTYNKKSDSDEKDFERKSLKLRPTMNSTFTHISEKERDQINNLEQSPTIKLSSNGYEKEQIKRADLNSTYNKEQNNLNNTFRKSNEYNNLNRTFDRKESSVRNNLDSTYEKSVIGKNTSLQSKLKDQIASECHEKKTNDQVNLRRLSAEIDEYLSEKMNDVHDRYGCNNAVRLSADSSDSLDRMSSLSNSSRESRHISMADVDAIVEQQERSLQVMSTPKPAKSLTKLFEHTYLSPIPNLNAKEHLSDSEISSEDYKSAHAAVSGVAKRTLDRNVKSLSNLKYSVDAPKPRGINTMSSNLRTMSKLKGSYGNLRAPENTKIRGSYSNLRSMGPNLKGSYTNLRPFNSNLPNIPPPSCLNTTTTFIRSDPAVHEIGEPRDTEVFKVPQLSKDQHAPNANGTFVKPPSRISSLPRPVSSATGIPRPMSKIPAPKSVRSSSATAGGRSLMRPSSKVNVNDGFY